MSEPEIEVLKESLRLSRLNCERLMVKLQEADVRIQALNQEVENQAVRANNAETLAHSRVDRVQQEKIVTGLEDRIDHLDKEHESLLEKYSFSENRVQELEVILKGWNERHTEWYSRVKPEGEHPDFIAASYIALKEALP